MNLSLENKAQNIFLHKDSTFDLDCNVNLILSPELYWVREFNIPVKNEKEALRFLPSFFEDILEEDKEYKYHVKKLDDESFLSFAYEVEVLKEVIKKANINISKIVNIYLGQFELEEFGSFMVDEKSFYYSDGILVKLPKNLEHDGRRLQSFDNVKLSDQKIKFDLYPKWLQSGTIISISILLLLVSIFNFAKVYSYNLAIEEFETKKQELIKSHKLPSSMIQLKSIIKNTQNKEQIKDKNKEVLSYLLGYKKRAKGLKFLSIEFNTKDIVIKLSSKNKKDVENYKKYIVKKYKPQVTQQKENYTIKVKL